MSDLDLPTVNVGPWTDDPDVTGVTQYVCGDVSGYSDRPEELYDENGAQQGIDIAEEKALATLAVIAAMRADALV